MDPTAIRYARLMEILLIMGAEDSTTAYRQLIKYAVAVALKETIISLKK